MGWTVPLRSHIFGCTLAWGNFVSMLSLKQPPLIFPLHQSIIPPSSPPVSSQPTLSYIRLPKLLFSSGTHCCVWKLREQRVGYLSPYIANGHPRNASSLWVWAAANHVASQCHWGTETEKRRSTLLSFFASPRNKRVHFVPILAVQVEVF